MGCSSIANILHTTLFINTCIIEEVFGTPVLLYRSPSYVTQKLSKRL